MEGKNFLVVTTDYFTNFFEVVEVPHFFEAATVITKMKCILARYGIPETLVADGGPQFDNLESKRRTGDSKSICHLLVDLVLIEWPNPNTSSRIKHVTKTYNIIS